MARAIRTYCSVTPVLVTYYLHNKYLHYHCCLHTVPVVDPPPPDGKGD